MSLHRRIPLAFVLVAAALAHAPGAWAQAGADSCTTPDVIAGLGTFAVDTTTSTFGGQQPACPNVTHDVWFQWTAPATGVARLSLCGGTAADTCVAVYAGASCPPAPEIVCNDDACGLQSEVSFAVTSGSSYVLQLYGFGTAVYAGSFSLALSTPPANDDCNSPTPIAGLGTFLADTSLATTGAQGQGSAACNGPGGTGIEKDVWFLWIATSSDLVDIETGGAFVDTKLAVYATSGCPGSAPIECNDNTCSLRASVGLRATAGTAYMIQLGGPPGGGGGTTSITIKTKSDECAGASSIPALPAGASSGSYTMSNNGATTSSPSGACPAYCAIPNDIWYQWNSGGGGTFEITTCGFDVAGSGHKVAVYVDCCSSPVVCDTGCPSGDEGRVCFSAAPATTYLIQVGNRSASDPKGGFCLEINALSTCTLLEDDCSGAFGILGPGPFVINTNNYSTGTQGQSEPACGFFGTTAIQGDGWFTWTAACTGPMEVSLCGGIGGADSKIAVYAGAGCPTGPALACNDDTCGLASSVSFSALAGSTYTLQIGSFPGAAPFAGTFTVLPTGSCVAPSTPFCFGDGTGTPCPCGNSGAAGNGCAHSANPNGANLASVGVASLAADTLTLQGSGMLNSSALYFQGTARVAGGNGTVFGDGLRCAGGAVLRLGVAVNSAGASQYPAPGLAPISIQGAIGAPGTRTYQVWYRNAAAFCQPATFNLTNGLEVAWGS